MTPQRGFLQFPQAGPRLNELRREHGMTLEQLGRVFGISSTAMRSIEIGKNQPSLHLLIRAARFFSIPLEELAGENVEGLAS